LKKIKKITGKNSLISIYLLIGQKEFIKKFKTFWPGASVGSFHQKKLLFS